MASFVLVPGAGGMAWYWHRVVPLIRAAGHQAIAVDLPGFGYADVAIECFYSVPLQLHCGKSRHSREQK